MPGKSRPRSTFIIASLIPILILMTIGFAPFGLIFDEYTNTHGPYLDFITSVLLLVRYPKELKNDFLFVISALPLYFIMHSFTSAYDFSPLVLLKFYAFFVSWNHEKKVIKLKYEKAYIIIIPLCFVMLLTHALACVWLIVEKPETIATGTDYNKAFYWVVTTLTTVGYGDYVPTSNISRLFTCIIMILGVGVYGFTISQMSRLVLSQDSRKAVYIEKVAQLNSFLNHYKVPKELRLKAREYYDHSLSSRINTVEKQILSELPNQLRGELIDHIILKQIGSSKIFKHCPVSVLGAVAEYFEEVYLSPGEVLFNEGDDPDSMYIILYGDMELKKNGKIKESLSRLHIFGELSLVLKENRYTDAVAESYVDLIKLSRENLYKMMEKYPVIEENVKSIVVAKKKSEK